MIGYYKNPELTNQVMISQTSYMLTGDLAIEPQMNCYKIVGSLKPQFKLNQGEYIHPERLEKIYTDKEVIQDMFVIGLPLKSWLVAIVYIAKEEAADESETHKKVYKHLVEKAKVHTLKG